MHSLQLFVILLLQILIRGNMTAVSVRVMPLLLVQGATHGATVAYLKDRMEGQAKNQFTTVALQISHILLTSARTFSSIGFLGVIAKATCALTPLAIASDLYSKDITFFSEKTAKILSRAYVGAMVANAVALFILGNPIGALASVAILGIDAIASGAVKDIVNRAKSFSALATLILEGADSLVEKGALSSLTSVSMTLVGAKEALDSIELGDVRNKKTVVLPEVRSEVLPEIPVVAKDPEIVQVHKPWYSFLEFLGEPIYR